MSEIDQEPRSRQAAMARRVGPPQMRQRIVAAPSQRQQARRVDRVLGQIIALVALVAIVALAVHAFDDMTRPEPVPVFGPDGSQVWP